MEKLILDRVELIDLMQIIPWRNDCMESLRTSTLTNEHMQKKYYETIHTDKSYRMYSVRDASDLLALTGFSNISLDNRNAEINIIVNPKKRNSKLGEQIIDMIFDVGFSKMNLEYIYGECYKCNKAISFWERIIEKYDGSSVTLPARKYYNNKYYDSLYFTIDEFGYNNLGNEELNDYE